MEITSAKEQQEEKRQIWKEQVHRWRESGLSQKEYCRQNHLRENQLTYWKKRFMEPEPTLSLVELKVGGGHFSKSASLRLNLGSAYQVEVDRGFDPVTLKELIYTLGQV